MPNKIHQQLKQLAKEILKLEEPYKYQKVYDATFQLFEYLILIKNTEGFNKDFWEDSETNFDRTVDFIKPKPESERPQEHFSDQEELTPIMDTIKEIDKEIPEVKPSVTDLFEDNNIELLFEKKKEVPIANNETQKSLNDKFSKTLNIDLNDRTAFIKYLFDKNPNDYHRAISQITTLQNWEAAQKFILEMIKPDYNYWEGKEQYESRFLKIIENNFQ
ncbi:MAG: hypothetical protein CBD39_00145 [Flavobacteriaceae bacterium TMED179]|nr:MAG: hypothetical protein CBD39_00145 [Flavobacteriaceae bacterium TMED179]|tara:strand:- start:28369 stop:29022 length:654 start_codon:yes stop_codon:yes gene_type:complete